MISTVENRFNLKYIADIDNSREYLRHFFFDNSYVFINNGKDYNMLELFNLEAQIYYFMENYFPNEFIEDSIIRVLNMNAFKYV